MTRYNRVRIGVVDESGHVTSIEAGMRSAKDDTVTLALATWACTERQARGLVNLGDIQILNRHDLINESQQRRRPRWMWQRSWAEEGMPATHTSRNALLEAARCPGSRVEAVVVLEDGRWSLWRVFSPDAREALATALESLANLHESVQRAMAGSGAHGTPSNGNPDCVARQLPI